MRLKTYSLIDKIVTWINENTSLFIMTTSQHEVGNTADEIHMGFLFAKRHNKRLVILRLFQILGFPKTCNKEIFRVRSAQSVTGPGALMQWGGTLLLTLIRGHLPLLAKYLVVNSIGVLKGLKIKKRWSFYDNLFLGTEYLWNPKPGSLFSKETSNLIDWKKEFATPLDLFLDPAKSRKAEKSLQDMGLSPSDWFVCLHVREGGFHGDLKNHRNCNIDNYLEGIKAITGRGGWVIRIGDTSMKRLPPMERVIDYPFSPYKSDFMDIYLIKNCRFYVGQNSGPWDIAKLFHKKLVVVNATEFIFATPHYRNNFIILKHVFSKKLKRYLSVKELVSGSGKSHDLNGANSDDFIFTENTPAEIKAVIVETLDSEKDFTPSLLQKEFDHLRVSSAFRFIEAESILLDTVRPPFTKIGFNNIIRFRVASQTTGALGTIGRSFVEENWEEDSLNTLKPLDAHSVSASPLSAI